MSKEKKMFISVRELLLRARKPVPPTGGPITPKKGGSYNRAREKTRGRKEDC